jgi:hypothetical protein
MSGGCVSKPRRRGASIHKAAPRTQGRGRAATGRGFEPPAGPLRPDPERAEALESERRPLRRELSEYGQGLNPADTPTVELVDALRRILEVVMGQQLSQPAGGAGEQITPGLRRRPAAAPARQARRARAGGRGSARRRAHCRGPAPGGDQRPQRVAVVVEAERQGGHQPTTGGHPGQRDWWGGGVAAQVAPGQAACTAASTAPGGWCRAPTARS